MQRDVLYYHTPSERQWRLWNPVTKKEILAAYERRLKILELRRIKDVKVQVEFHLDTVDAVTKELISRSEPELRIHLKWKLSEQDYQYYRKGLEEWFREAKIEYNRRLKEKIESKASDNRQEDLKAKA